MLTLVLISSRFLDNQRRKLQVHVLQGPPCYSDVNSFQ